MLNLSFYTNMFRRYKTKLKKSVKRKMVYFFFLKSTVLKELRTCFNSRYDDVISFMKRYEAMSEQSTEEGVFCP